MENINYSYDIHRITLYEDKYVSRRGYYPFPNEYVLVYLVSEGKENDAIQSIEERFRIKKDDDFEWDYYGNLKFLEEPSSEYIQLASLKICNYFLSIPSLFIQASNITVEQLSKAICDERYSYIIDYINTVIDYRLDKNEFIINLDEMIMLADKFVKEHKRTKSLSKKKLTN